jgi:AcrR family transcriptional regulator
MPTRPARRQAPPKPYHHGDLRAALVAASLAIIEERGPEQVTVREAAKRAGVSSGAPFRHFPNRTALMTAVAEEAQRRFRAEIDAALAAAPNEPLARFHALGEAYLRWAIRNPSHFRVISARNLIDYDSSPYLTRDNDEIRAMMSAALIAAARNGNLATSDVAHLQIAARACVYGLARMYIDGHFAQWGRAGETAEATMAQTLGLFMELLAGGPAGE